MKDYYKLLKVEKEATLKEIKSSYRKLKKEYGEKNQKGKLKSLEEAYQVLSNEDKRKEYDQKEVAKEKVANKTEKKKSASKEVKNEKVVTTKEAEKKKETKEVKKEKEEKPKKNIAGVLIALVAAVGIIVGLFVISENANITAKIDEKALTDITVDEFLQYYDGEEKTFVMVGYPQCTWCQQYKPILTRLNTTYDLDIKFLNIEYIGSEKYNQVAEINGESFGTPLTLVVSNGEIVDRINGYVDQSTVEEFLKKNGFIPE